MGADVVLGGPFWLPWRVEHRRLDEELNHVREEAEQAKQQHNELARKAVAGLRLTRRTVPMVLLEADRLERLLREEDKQQPLGRRPS